MKLTSLIINYSFNIHLMPVLLSFSFYVLFTLLFNLHLEHFPFISCILFSLVAVKDDVGKAQVFLMHYFVISMYFIAQPQLCLKNF